MSLNGLQQTCLCSTLQCFSAFGFTGQQAHEPALTITPEMVHCGTTSNTTSLHWVSHGPFHSYSEAWKEASFFKKLSPMSSPASQDSCSLGVLPETSRRAWSSRWVQLRIPLWDPRKSKGQSQTEWMETGFQEHSAKDRGFIECLTHHRVPLVAQTVKNLPAMQETRVQFLDQEGCLEKEWQPIPVLLLRESHGQRSLAGYSP